MNQTQNGFAFGCGLALALVVVPGLLVGGCVIAGLATVQQSAQQAADRETAALIAERTPEKQAQRAKLIGELRAKGVFNRIEKRNGGLVRVWTGPRWDGLDVQTKQSFAGLVYAYHFDGRSYLDAVVLHDGRTGKETVRMMRTGLEVF